MVENGVSLPFPCVSHSEEKEQRQTFCVTITYVMQEAQVKEPESMSGS